MSAAVSFVPSMVGDAEERAEALALLQLAIVVHDVRRADVDAAVAAHCISLDDLIAARERYAAAGEVVTNAIRLVEMVRGYRP